MEKYELIALVAGQLSAAGRLTSIKDRVHEAAQIVEAAQVEASLALMSAKGTALSQREEDRTGNLFADIEKDLKKIESDLDSMPPEDERPKKRGRPRKEASAPMATSSVPVLAPMATSSVPVPAPTAPPKQKVPQLMYEYSGFCCDKCSNDKMRVSLFENTEDAEAYCCACGFNEKFKISAEDRADVLAKGTLRSGTLPASALPAKEPKEPVVSKKAAPVVQPAAATGAVTTKEWTDPKTGKLMLMESWTDAAGEEFRRVREAPADLPSPSGQWSDGTPAVPSSKSLTKSSASETQPTTKSTATSSSEYKSEPPQSSPNPNAIRVAESVMAYQPPPVDLDGARAELHAMVAAWPREKQIEKFEKVLHVTWDDTKVEEQINKLVSAMLGVFG
jgi:hypothetical protein